MKTKKWSRWTKQDVEMAKEVLLTHNGDKAAASFVVAKSLKRPRRAVYSQLCRISTTLTPTEASEVTVTKRTRTRSAMDLMALKAFTDEMFKNLGIVSKSGFRVELHEDHIRIYS